MHRASRIVKAQFVACLLCLLIVGVSLDGLPDPPAVKPQGNLSDLVSQLHSHVPAASNHVWDHAAFAVHFECRLSSVAQISEGKPPSYDLDLVRQATDVSPPCLF